MQSKKVLWAIPALALSLTTLALQPSNGNAPAPSGGNANDQTSQPGSIYTGEAPKPLVSVSTFTPADQVIAPLSLADRIRLDAVPKRGMCSTVPAARAEDGLLTGDGKMWTEVFGDPFAEQVIFHQENLIQPWKGKQEEAPKIANVLPEVRKLMLAGEYRKALELAIAEAEKGDTKPNTANLAEHPAFDMRIDTAGQHAVQDYLRTTDFESGEVKVTWKDKDGVWERRTFVSRPDNVVVQLLTAPAGAGINSTLKLDTSRVLGSGRQGPPGAPGAATPGAPRQSIRIADGGGGGGGFGQRMHDPGSSEVHFERSFDPTHLILQGRYVVEPGFGNPGYASVTRVVADGGTTSVDNDSLVLQGVHSLTLITRIEAYPEMKQDEVDALKSAVDQINPKYDELLAKHRPTQASVIDRESMDFGGSAAVHSMSGEEMLADQRSRFGYNPGLLANMFDMGRYWLYMRTGSLIPVWGHVNINVNLQESEVVMGDLPETMKAYVDWVERQLPDARNNAKNIFGARGALFAIHPTERDGPLDHFDFGWPHQYWISAGGWVYSPIWDYYLATGDQQFLRDHVVPGLKELGLFYEDYLTETDKNGNYIFVPSYSPENYPRNSDNTPSVINATMDISVCKEVFTHLIAAAQILGTDADQIPKWKAILAKMPPYLTEPDGSLKEWAWPTLTENYDHRHVSHLYGAWPGDEFTPDATPDLAKAALMAARKRAQGNASAHGLLHRGLASARLKDPYLVNFDLKQLLEQGYVNSSLVSMHNPYAMPAPDPQGGIPTLIMEMLIYSRPGVIGLLPASPDSITEGTVKGILCRTQAKIDDLTWNLDKKKIDVTISSLVDQDIHLFVRRGIEKVEAPKGALVGSVKPGAVECNVHLTKSHPVTLHFSVGSEDRLAWVPKAAD